MRERFDTKRGSLSLAELGLKDLGKWVSIKGYYGDVMIIVTRNKFIDPVDKRTQRLYVPENGLLIASLGIQGVMMYGVIRNIKAVKEGMEEGDRFVGQWEEADDPADIYTMTETSPAAVQPDTGILRVYRNRLNKGGASASTFVFRFFRSPFHD